MHLSSGTILQGGRYRIIEKIGQGGFGIVYSAYHEGLQCNVCIKEFFFSDLCERANNSSQITIISCSKEKIQLVDTLRRKFLKEAQRLAQFQNPHIIHVMDNFEENNTAYFVMEYIEGGTLEDLILQNGAMSEAKAKKIILPIIDALEAVHKKGLLHLDIKPANIMLRKDQSAVLIDFGISKYMGMAGGHTTTAPIGLSKGYAPLEQYGGTITDFSTATDTYSLCATLYKMVTGITPPEPLQIIASGLKSPSDLQPQLSVGINKAIVRGLSTKATDRPQTMSELRSQFSNTENNSGRITTPTNPTIVTSKPQKTIYSWFVVFLIGIVIIIGFHFYKSNLFNQNIKEEIPIIDTVAVAVDTTYTTSSNENYFVGGDSKAKITLPSSIRSLNNNGTQFSTNDAGLKITISLEKCENRLMMDEYCENIIRGTSGVDNYKYPEDYGTSCWYEAQDYVTKSWLYGRGVWYEENQTFYTIKVEYNDNNCTLFKHIKENIDSFITYN